jgi:hypothetical protein
VIDGDVNSLYTEKMKKQLITATMALAFLCAIGTGVAGAGTPAYTLTCVGGGDTTATWDHTRLASLRLVWSGADSFTDFNTPQLSTKGRPRGFVVVPTPTGLTTGASPASVTVSFTRTDGTTDQVTAACV